MIQGMRSAIAFSTLPEASRVDIPEALGGKTGSAVSQPGGKPRSLMLSICAARSGYCSPVPREGAAPLAAEPCAARTELRGEMFAHAGGNDELLIGVEAEELLGQPHFVVAKRLAVGLGRVLLVRGAIADMAVHDDQRRPVARLLEAFIGLLQHCRVVGVADTSTSQP